MSQRSILITGCSSGIGYNAAQTLQARGVLASCRSEEDCLKLQAQGLESFTLDYADEESVARGAAQALDRTNGELDALFNNGAYAIPGLVDDLPRNALRAIFETNFFGQFDLINQVLPAMRARNQGRIINCSSILGIEPGPINTKIREKSIPHFEKWIDWEQSPHSKKYEGQLRPRLYTPSAKKDRFELEPDAVTAKLIRALEDPRPKPRYYVTTPTYLAGFLKRCLSTRAFDKFCLKI